MGNKGCLCLYMWMTSKRLDKKQNMSGRNSWNWSILQNQLHFLTMNIWDVLGVNANRMKQLLKQFQKMFASRISAGATEKVTRVGNTSRKDGGLVLRLGRTWWNMRWAILWIGKQESRAVMQSFKSLPGWPSIQTERTWISWRIITSLLPDCLKMLVLGTNWKTRHSVVGQQTCKSSHRMGMRQTIGKFGFLRSSHKGIPTMLSCGQHGSALSIGVISRLWLCGRSWRLEINFGWNLMYLSEAEHLPPSVGCARSKRQYPTVLQNPKSFLGCWIAHGWTACSRSCGT